MSKTRKPAASTVVKQQAAEIEKLTKELASEKGSKDYHIKQAAEANRELQSIHEFLNAVPNPPPEKATDGYSRNSAMTRLSVFLATRGFNASPNF